LLKGSCADRLSGVGAKYRVAWHGLWIGIRHRGAPSMPTNTRPGEGWPCGGASPP